mgnify:CR=1 FL=1
MLAVSLCWCLCVSLLPLAPPLLSCLSSSRYRLFHRICSRLPSRPLSPPLALWPPPSLRSGPEVLHDSVAQPHCCCLSPGHGAIPARLAPADHQLRRTSRPADARRTNGVFQWRPPPRCQSPTTAAHLEHTLHRICRLLPFEKAQLSH